MAPKASWNEMTSLSHYVYAHDLSLVGFLVVSFCS